MFVTFKRWALKEGYQEADLVELIRSEIMPAYAQLDGCLGIGLLRIEGEQVYLATQYWQSQTARDAVSASEMYATWWQAYQPSLEKWDEMMLFVDEWEAVDVLGGQTGSILSL
jgi:hypothetical protein